MKVRKPASLPTAARIEEFIFKREPSRNPNETHSVFDVIKDEKVGCETTPEEWVKVVDMALESRRESFPLERAFINRAFEITRGGEEHAATRSELGKRFAAIAAGYRAEQSE